MEMSTRVRLGPTLKEDKADAALSTNNALDTTTIGDHLILTNVSVELFFNQEKHGLQ